MHQPLCQATPVKKHLLLLSSLHFSLLSYIIVPYTTHIIYIYIRKILLYTQLVLKIIGFFDITYKERVFNLFLYNYYY